MRRRRHRRSERVASLALLAVRQRCGLTGDVPAVRSRRDGGAARNARTSRGFTVLELLVALAVSAVLAGGALLGWRRVEAALTLDRALHQLAADLQTAHVLAIASATRVRLVFAIGTASYVRERLDDDGAFVADAAMTLPRGHHDRGRELRRRPGVLGARRRGKRHGHARRSPRHGAARAAQSTRAYHDPRGERDVTLVGVHLRPRRGSALIEALAALALVALAASVVVTAATASLRAIRLGRRVEQSVALATDELSALQARRPAVPEDVVREEPALGPSARSESSVVSAGPGVVALRVTVASAPDQPPVVLETRAAVPE